jgi:hypothetical protein
LGFEAVRLQPRHKPPRLQKVWRERIRFRVQAAHQADSYQGIALAMPPSPQNHAAALAADKKFAFGWRSAFSAAKIVSSSVSGFSR